MRRDYEAELKAYGEIADSLVVCPHCFQEDEDAWEYNLPDGGSTEVTCGGCERKFHVACSITVDYTTKKIEE